MTIDQLEFIQNLLHEALCPGGNIVSEEVKISSWILIRCECASVKTLQRIARTLRIFSDLRPSASWKKNVTKVTTRSLFSGIVINDHRCGGARVKPVRARWPAEGRSRHTQIDYINRAGYLGRVSGRIHPFPGGDGQIERAFLLTQHSGPLAPRALPRRRVRTKSGDNTTPRLLYTGHRTKRCCARGRPIIVEWERDARHSAGLSLVRERSAVEVITQEPIKGLAERWSANPRTPPPAADRRGGRRPHPASTAECSRRGFVSVRREFPWKQRDGAIKEAGRALANRPYWTAAGVGRIPMAGAAPDEIRPVRLGSTDRPHVFITHTGTLTTSNFATHE
ncbi:hypothetical protein EVAR_97900_1 [Eumeta japonica]|uniref:Uncharacterized protein n=1 Tax=Eumeta variegata TaxID=151549 RepID=A0A4C1WES8_EUMVA|nr:hypothetical protein EVAR_97900_1 [Eumeta japonica]